MNTKEANLTQPKPSKQISAMKFDEGRVRTMTKKRLKNAIRIVK